jgi:hypothetical protein
MPAADVRKAIIEDLRSQLAAARETIASQQQIIQTLQARRATMPRTRAEFMALPPGHPGRTHRNGIAAAVRESHPDWAEDKVQQQVNAAFMPTRWKKRLKAQAERIEELEGIVPARAGEKKAT